MVFGVKIMGRQMNMVQKAFENWQWINDLWLFREQRPLNYIILKNKCLQTTAFDIYIHKGLFGVTIVPFDQNISKI